MLLAKDCTKDFIYFSPQKDLGIETISLPILEMRKLRIREVNPFAENHATPLIRAKATGKAGAG